MVILLLIAKHVKYFNVHVYYYYALAFIYLLQVAEKLI